MKPENINIIPDSPVKIRAGCCGAEWPLAPNYPRSLFLPFPIGVVGAGRDVAAAKRRQINKCQEHASPPARDPAASLRPYFATNYIESRLVPVDGLVSRSYEL